MSRPASTFIAGFRDHPASVGESYLGHARFALGISGRLICAGLAALVHAAIPPLFETTASRILRDLNARMQARH